MITWFAVCLPQPLFNDSTSTVLEDRSGKLLSAKIADDGQWRFPQSDSIPELFMQALIHFEDEYFFYHPGVNPVSLFRAANQNISAGKIIRGGSTLTMQTIRLSRKGKSRTVTEKLIEIILAIRLEVGYSKKEILNLYASNAPFGGNVVGLEAAAWRYFGRKPHQLSLGELATLAVLPNAPALIYPGRNQEKLIAKRNKLLEKLYNKGVISNETCELAQLEIIPSTTFHIPRTAPHLLDRLIKEGHKGDRIHSTIDATLQEKVNKLTDDYHSVFSHNEIHNLAVLILDVEKGSVIAYTGNSNCPDEGSGKDVDVIMAPRSSGSILKPFLYAFMLQDGVILPHTLIPDIPTQIAGYTPKNFENTHDGVVPASEALARSLNVPAVRSLQDYGVEKFHYQLKKLNLQTINKPANHYGLSIILGGAETTLWDLCREYMKMAQTLASGKTSSGPVYHYEETEVKNQIRNSTEVFDPGAVWLTFEALSTLNRPAQETGWEEFQSNRKIAWKTGTSFGHRDGWAIGITPKHVVGVWVGNADGEGRPGLTGLGVAAPVLFKVFKHLPDAGWFNIPNDYLTEVTTCSHSGHIASASCTQTREIKVPLNSSYSYNCPYHINIHLDKSETYRVNSDCYPVHEMHAAAWFVLPPVQEWYYKKKNPYYKSLPPFSSDCGNEKLRNMAVVYPKNNTRIIVPRDLDGTVGKTVFEIVHRIPQSRVYWHLNNHYMGYTHNSHQMEMAPDKGNYIMTIVDERGESISWGFEVL